MRRLSWAIVLWLWAAPAFADVAYDLVTAASAVTASSVTFSHTVTGANVALYVSCSVTSGETISGITYNAVGMTQIAHVQFAADPVDLYTYRLVAPATGANNVIASFSASTGTKKCHATSFTGVDQTTSEGTVVTATSGGADAGHNQNTTTVALGMVYDTIVLKTSATNLAVVAGQTSRLSTTDGGVWALAVSTEPASTTTTNDGYTWDLANSHFVHFSVPIRPAASASCRGLLLGVGC